MTMPHIATIAAVSLITLGITHNLSANEKADNALYLGIAAQHEPSIYKKGKNQVKISPFRLNTDGFYTAGAAFNLKHTPQQRIYLGLGLDEWDSQRGDSDLTEGMAKLKTAVNIRAGAAWKTSAGIINVDVNRAVNAHKANQVRVRYTKPIPIGQVLWLPYASLQWLDKDVSNYYFGVKANEATATRPSYQLGNTAVFKAGIDLEYPLSRSWVAVAGAGITDYGRDIRNSPLVEKRTSPYTRIGLAYRFR